MSSENENSEEEWDLRKELGFPPVTSEEGGPEVDVALIEEFLSNEKMDPKDTEKVIDYAGRYASWREEYFRIVIRNYRERSAAMNNTPPPPEPS